MICCELCNSSDIIKATLKSGEKIGICQECGLVYELDIYEMPIMGHDPYDNEYFKKIESLFETYEELKNIEYFNKI